MSYRRSHDWGLLTSAEIAAARDAGALAVLPLGSCEQHGDHLPLDTDTLTAQRIAQLAAEQCADVHVLVLPTPGYGYSPHHSAFAGTVSLSAATLHSLVRDIAAGVRNSGFDRLLIVNGHGGNLAPLGILCTDLTTGGFVTGFASVYPVSADRLAPLLTGAMPTIGHACEFESSIVMALRDEGSDLIPARVRNLPAQLQPPGLAGAFGHPGYSYPMVFSARDRGYIGDPAQAGLAKGQQMARIAADGLARVFSAFAALRPDGG